MEIPTVENIKKAVREYKQHLDNGGLPTQIILEMRPSDSGVDWKLSVNNPPQQLLLSYFTLFMRDQIEEAAKPPSFLNKNENDN